MRRLFLGLIHALLCAAIAFGSSAEAQIGAGRTPGFRAALRTFSIAATNKDQIIATGGRIPNALVTSATIGSTKRSFKGRAPWRFGCDVTEFRALFDGWSMQNGIVLPAGPMTVDQLAFERDGTSTYTAATFAGSTSTSIVAGDKQRATDTITASALGFGASIPKGTLIWSRIRVNLPAGSDLLTNVASRMTGGYASYFDPASQTPTIYGTGALTFVSGESVLNIGYGPTVLVGKCATGGALSVIALGDSIVDGQGDTLNPQQATGFGFFQRAQVDGSNGNPIAGLNLSRNGTATSHWLDSTARSYWTPYLAYANVVVDELGTNDFGTGPGSTAASSTYTALQSLWSIYRAAGVQKIVRTRLQPRSGSTDSWATAANQSVATGWAPGGQRDILNGNFASALSSGAIDALVDLPSVWEDQANPGRWLTNGSANYPTTDGTHPSATFHGLGAAPLRSVLLGVTVQ